MKRLFLSFADVDWASTKAFAVGSFGQIYINLKGKRPQGIVEPGKQYEDLRKKTDAVITTCMVGESMGLGGPGDPVNLWKVLDPKVRLFRWYGVKKLYVYAVNKDTKRSVSTRLLLWADVWQWTIAREVFSGEELNIARNDEGYLSAPLTLEPGEGKLILTDAKVKK